MAGPVGSRLRRLEKRLGLAQPVPGDDEDERFSPEAAAESRAILDEMLAMRLARRLGREPSGEELAAEVAKREARMAEDEARLAEAGIKRLRLSDESLLILGTMQEERARVRALGPEGAP
jgi:hypothetical protein